MLPKDFADSLLVRSEIISRAAVDEALDALEPQRLRTFESVPECSLLIRVQQLGATRGELDYYITILVVREVEFSGSDSRVEDL